MTETGKTKKKREINKSEKQKKIKKPEKQKEINKPEKQKEIKKTEKQIEINKPEKQRNEEKSKLKGMIKKEFNGDNLAAFIYITLGAVIAAFALEEFLVPNNILDGGITGISMFINHFLKTQLGILIFIFNLPFIIIAFIKNGKRHFFKIVYAMILFSCMTSVFSDMPDATFDIILATCYGGIILGVGVGLVLKGGGCIDGTEVVAILISKKTTLSVGRIVLLFNVVIYSIAAVKFGLDRGMYSLLMYFITSKVIDIVDIGFDNTKSVMIISDNGGEIADVIYEKLGRTVTFISGKGYVSNDTKDILYCVVTRSEISELKQIIHGVKGSTFTTISDISEIVGNHVKSS